jgi:hypothetical protein
LAGAALVGYLVFPPPAVVVTALPQVGQIADRTVVAPFSFETRKSPEEIASEGESRALSVRPVYRYSPTAYDSALSSARSFFAELERAEQQGPDLLRAVAAARANLSAAEAGYLADESRRRRIQAIVTHFLAETLSRGVADAGVLRSEPARQVSLRRGEGERAVPRDSVLTFADLIDRAEAAASNLDDPVGQRTVRRLVSTFYQPTIVPDLALTASRREQLRASVDRVKYYVSAGERVDRRHNLPPAGLLGPEDFALFRERFRANVRLIGAMHRAGVPSLAGTDVGNPYLYPGFSLHDELAQLVEAGLTPAAALRTATVYPARWLVAADTLGTIARGKVDDLVLLDANPLVDIASTRLIAAVVTHGRYLDRAALDTLLKQARTAASPGP